MIAPRTDWVAAARRTPLLDIGQLDPDVRRALDAAVHRGELVRGRIPFAGFLAAKTCYARDHAAIAAKAASDRAATTRAAHRDADRREASRRERAA